MIKKNVPLSGKVKVSNWRKSAAGTYHQSGDCQVYAIETVNIEPALAFIDHYPENISLTHLVGKACGLMIEKYPQINRLLSLGSFYQRKEISIFFQVAVDDKGEDLSGHTVRQINKLNLSQIAQDMNQTVKNIKKGNDIHYKKVKSTLSIIPNWLVSPFISLYGHILYTFNIWSPLFGAPKDSFGSMMITNIGSLGMQTALVPLVPFSRCPLILAIGDIYEKAVVKDGQIMVQKSMDCGWTLDHRIIDGVVGAKMAKYFKRLIENPELLEVK